MIYIWRRVRQQLVQERRVGAKSGGADSLLRLRLRSLILKKGKRPRKVVGLQRPLAPITRRLWLGIHRLANMKDYNCRSKVKHVVVLSTHTPRRYTNLRHSVVESMPHIYMSLQGDIRASHRPSKTLGRGGSLRQYKFLFCH